MAFARLFFTLALAWGAAQTVWAKPQAGRQRLTTCATGQQTANAACCALFPIVETIQRDLFDGGECGEDAHAALRLAFHDAIGWSTRGNRGGGADGSILAFNRTEGAYAANPGINDIVDRQFPVFLQTGLSAGDFVHLAAALGTVNCAGAPRLQFMLGRPAPRAAAPDNTVPSPVDSMTSMLARFADAGFSAQEAVALLASHSIAAADVVDPSVPGTPLDSTPTTFDSQIFLEVLLPGRFFPGDGQQGGEVLAPIAGEMRIQSDLAFARDFRTACFWQAMVNNQQRMMSQFRDAMAKMQLLGQNSRRLVDCSDVLPVPPAFNSPIRYPPTFSRRDVRLSCPILPFPNLATSPGPAMTLTPMPP